MDLSAAYSEIKSLPDHELKQELSRPTGLYPAYLIAGELNDRKTLRSSTPSHYSRGGLVAGINPFNSMMKGLDSFKDLQFRHNKEAGLQSPMLPGQPYQPMGIDQLVPLPPGQLPALQEPKHYAGGGLVERQHLAEMITQAASRMGVSPLHLATIMSYETGGTFNPVQPGPVTKWGRHRGLIQFGEPQAKALGINWNDPVNSQLGPGGAVEKYMWKAGVRPGTGLLDMYSAVNAGSVGKYGAVDNGTTVAEKVASMRRNMQQAANLLNNGSGTIAYKVPSGIEALGSALGKGAAQQAGAAVAQQAATQAVKASPLGGLAGLMAMAAMAQKPPPPPAQMTVPKPRVPYDPVLMAEDTSQTPNYYRNRRRRRYG